MAPQPEIQLLGAIFCGGQSTRMGTDKGLLLKNGQYWVAISHKKLSALCPKVIISINASQYHAYSKIFTSDPFVIDKPGITGPLAGLLSLHIYHPDKDLLIMACDMIDMGMATIKALIETYQKEKNNYEAFVYQNNDGHTEPFLSIFTKNGVEKIRELFESNELAKFSMKHVLGTLHTCYISIPEDKLKEFKNYNYLSDITGRE